MKFDTTSNFFWMYDEWNGKKIDKAHMPLYIFRSKYPNYFELFSSYFAFMFVRNPYSKFLSSFNELNRDIYKKFQLDNDIESYKSSVNDFAISLTASNIKPWEHKTHRFVPQKDLAYLDKKRKVDLILKIEEWDLSLRKLATFDEEVAGAIRNHRKVNEKPVPFSYLEILSAASKRRLSEIYKDDFLLFDYNFE